VRGRASTNSDPIGRNSSHGAHQFDLIDLASGNRGASVQLPSCRAQDVEGVVLTLSPASISPFN
jgi:hypothetical protein